MVYPVSPALASNSIPFESNFIFSQDQEDEEDEISNIVSHLSQANGWIHDSF